MQLSFKSGKFNLDSKENLSLAEAVKASKHHDVHESAQKVLNRCLAKHYGEPSLPPLLFLDEHQRRGIKWILTRSRTYLAHAPGAGKTCQSIIASCLIPMAGQTLFIVPPTLTTNWVREINHFSKLISYYPSVSVVPQTLNAQSMIWTADFIICPDSMLTKKWVYTELLKLKPKFIAVDEASRFKEPLSQRSKAFYGGVHNETVYPGIFHDARHTVFLDGSPMPNRPLELWAPAYALDPECIEYLDFYSFGFRYCAPTLNRFTKQWEFKGSTNEVELKSRLTKNFMHVVKEEELKHPERMRSILLMNEDTRSPEVKAWEQKNVSRFSSLTLKDSDSKYDVANIRREIGLSKMVWVSRYVRDRLKEKNEYILLFCWHREVAEGLSMYLNEFKPKVIYGGTSNAEREKAFKDFQSGKTKLLIGNILSLGRGHNLQKADRIIFAEYSWTDELNKQCEKRSSRKGSTKKSVRCEYICIPDSMDEVVLRSVFRKQKMVEKIID